MSVFESLSLSALVLGGAWALLQFHFSLRSKLEEQKSKFIEDALQKLNELVESIAAQVRALEDRLDLKIFEISEKIHELKIEITKAEAEIHTTRERFEVSYKHFASVVDKLRSEKLRIGENAILMRSKKDDN